MNFDDFLSKYLDEETKKQFVEELQQKQRKNIIYNDIFLKAGNNTDILFFNNLVKEINLYNLNKDNEVFPKIIDSYVSDDRCVIVLKKIEGNVIGEQRNTFCENKLTEEERKNILNKIQEIKSIKINMDLDANYTRSEKFEKYMDKISNLLTQSQINFLYENKDEICFTNCDYVISHGDLIPPNIMIVNGQPKFIDWEFISKKTQSYDSATFLMFSKEKNALDILQDINYENSYKREIEKDAIILCLKEINNWNKLHGRVDENIVNSTTNRWLCELDNIINIWRK